MYLHNNILYIKGFHMNFCEGCEIVLKCLLEIEKVFITHNAFMQTAWMSINTDDRTIESMEEYN